MRKHRKEKRNRRRLLAVVSVFAVLSTGCARETEETPAEEQEVTIPMILTVDSSTGIKNEEKLVEAFNEAYEGVWQVEVDWIMETEEEYRQNLKRQNVTDTLPAVISEFCIKVTLKVSNH